ncbi:MAG: UvrD-helicase domain-containing protein, partial [Alistipes sp.]|nr:UvrD-helicase domain-containing protein [Alistipes sp.]
MKASIYNASAGSGKTYRLAYNYVRTIIRDPQNYSHILAVTFTNKATEEMKNRILKELHLLAAGKRSRYRKDLRQELKLGDAELQQRAAQGEQLILHNYSRFTVLTIDRFFQRILRAFLHELDIDLNYSIELDTETL